MFRIAWVPFLYPCSERKGKTLGLGGACFSEHVAALLGASGLVKGFGPVRCKIRVRILTGYGTWFRFCSESFQE